MDGEEQLRNSSSVDDSDASETDDVSEEEQSWISWFCSIRGNEFFCEVEEDYIHDEFNLTGLSQEVPYFDYALDTILDVDSPNADLLTEEQQETVDAAAELLYGLIHARYILTTKGLNAMFDKFQSVEFNRCSRILCEGQPLLPVGQSDIPRKFTVSLYCPRCNDIYFPKSSKHANIDGAYFGTTFPHLFLMTFPVCVPSSPSTVYIPRVFGFRIRRQPPPQAEDGAEGELGGAASSLPDGAAYTVIGSAASGAASGAGAVRMPGPASAGAAAAASVTEARADAQARRIREIATVLPKEAAAARRLAGQDDFLDEEEEEEAAAAAVVTGLAALRQSNPNHVGENRPPGGQGADEDIATEEDEEEEGEEEIEEGAGGHQVAALHTGGAAPAGAANDGLPAVTTALASASIVAQTSKQLQLQQRRPSPAAARGAATASNGSLGMSGSSKRPAVLRQGDDGSDESEEDEEGKPLSGIRSLSKGGARPTGKGAAATGFPAGRRK